MGYTKEKQYKKGEAYAFFSFKGNKENIEKEMRDICIEENGIHPNLELYLTKAHPTEVHPDLDEYNFKADESYTLRATLSGVDNKSTAEELGHAINLLYGGVVLSDIEAGYKKDGVFHYEDKGEFHPVKNPKNKDASTGN